MNKIDNEHEQRTSGIASLARLRRIDGGMRRTGSEVVIDRVDAHQRQPFVDGLAGVVQTLDDLAGDAKAQVAFSAHMPGRYS
jgi:hypothetical protein